MNNRLKVFCVTNRPIKLLENSDLILAGVGKDKFADNYLKSNNQENIDFKEKYYSELTFHYWYWKNLLKEEKSDWIGFCQKRRFWIKKESYNLEITSENLKDHLLKEIPEEWHSFESVICSPIYINNVKKMKMLKRGFRSLLRDPSIFFNKKKQTIKFHFDMHHGYGNIDLALDCINQEDKFEFKKYLSNNISYNPHIMFITKPEIAKKWFYSLFTWLENCEKIFGFEKLTGYDTTRLYAYLAERYLSFWFKKYTKHTSWPWIFCDLEKNNFLNGK